VTDAQDRDAALDELSRLVHPNSVPTISTIDLEDILDANKRAQRWLATTTLNLGAVVMPTVRVGRVFRVIQEGIAGAVEPTWPTGDEDTVVDGTATLINAGVDFENVYDVRGAAEECWAFKERKAIQLALTDPGFVNISEQCREQRRSLASVLIA
jgi:hypothetical protein